MRLCVNSKAMQVKVQREKESCNGTIVTKMEQWKKIITTTVKQVRAFLGFGNFYWWFIWHFSDLVKPLNDLLKKDQKFEWTIDCQKAFDELKKWFTEEPILIMPDHTRPFQIETDASKYATGAVLTQMDLNGDRHPISFISNPPPPLISNREEL